jgi:heavy metal translocating P-type ATPase
LHELAPRSAFVLQANGETIEKAVREIQPGQNLLIKAGEIVPLDGVVIAGSSYVSLKHLTGESEPLPKKQGDPLPAGARNLDGTLSVEVTRSSSDSTLSRIIQLITQAQEAKPKLQRLLDRFGKWYALIIIGLFFFFALTLPLFTSLSYLGMEGSVYRALTFLIAASPCALVIATPTAYLSAISSCAKKGILLKGGLVLDALARCTRIAFDKTGTLTTGDLQCTALRQLSVGKVDELSALKIAATLEQHATHPIAKAICVLAESKGLPKLPLRDFRSHPGAGLEASVLLNNEWAKAFIGHESFIRTQAPNLKISSETAEAGRAFLLVEGSIYAFSFSDALREEAMDAIASLKREHPLKLAMLTGDSLQNAGAIGKKLGIDEIAAGLRPEDKLAKVADWATEGLIMIGDGINDAPALARATVGISMGRIGSASAVEASDVVLIRDDLSVLSWLISKAKKSMQIVRQNLLLALSVIVFATTPALLGLIPLWLAVVLHEGGTVLVGLNSLRLLQTRS